MSEQEFKENIYLNAKLSKLSEDQRREVFIHVVKQLKDQQKQQSSRQIAGNGKP